MSMEKFRVGKDIAKAKRMVRTGKSEVQDMKRAAKRKFRRRSNRSLKQVDSQDGDEIDILNNKPELTGCDIA